MPNITTEQLIQAANDLDKPQFSRADIAQKLGTDRTELRDAFKDARRRGVVEKTGEDAEGKGQFRLTEV